MNNITVVCNKEHRITPGECSLCERDASEHNFSIEHAALVEACKVLGAIAAAKRFDRTVFADDEAFVDWAQSLARHTLAKLN